jgi:hypothetical protein
MPEIAMTHHEDVVILNLEFGRVVNRRRIPSETDAVETEIDRDMLHLGVDLFDAKELRACQNFQARLKTKVKGYCVPSFTRGGMYMVKLAAIETVDEILKEGIAGFDQYVKAFADVVETRRDESKERLGKAFDADAYPSRNEVHEKYRIEYNWLMMGTPDALPKDIFQRERKKSEASLKAAESRINLMLALEVKGMGDHLIERLTPSDDPQAKPKQIRKSAVENIREYLKTFNLRNIGSTEELDAQVERMDAILSGVDSKDLKDSASLRDSVKKEFEGVTQALDMIIVATPKRFMAKEEDV